MPLRLAINEADLTLGDLEDFEDACGIPLADAVRPIPITDEWGNVVKDDDGRPATIVKLSIKQIKALVWIAGRKTDPTFTLADARDVRVSELEWTAAEDADPKE
jgi:hypothetical protein